MLNTSVPKTKRPDIWNAQTYEASFSFVTESGQSLVDELRAQPHERILDLGCGTGALTARIAGLCREVVGIDKSRDMIAKARREHPKIRFVEGDAADMVFDAPFDAVFSNAALHWMQPPELVAERIAGALAKGGRFVAELGGQGNVQALVSGLYLAFEANGLAVPGDRNPWYYPSIGEYASLLESQGFDVTFARLFDRPTPLSGGEAGLAGWYEMFAAPFFEGVAPAQKRDILAYAAFVLRDSLFINGVWYADYRRLRVHARKM